MIKGQKVSSILHYFEKIGTNLSTVEYFKTYFFILILLKYLNYKISCFFINQIGTDIFIDKNK